ncbi:MAG: DUF5794 domain-containing protein [Candidatus Nanohaloarchaea archaeon]|nr:DUF5794 domain-containing protein [Candidatus Nanohaloarchaea archaeon]
MVLDYLDDGAQRLVLVLCLPLVDGVFATLLVTGALETFSDFVAVGLTVFSGAGSLAVLYSYSETVEEARKMVLKAAPLLILGAAATALVAPFFDSFLYVSRMRYAAGLALVVISASLLDLDMSDSSTVPAIILTGFVLSVKDPTSVSFTYSYLLPALTTAGLALVGLMAAAHLPRRRISLYYIRRGGSMVLLIIALSLFGLQIPSEAGLAVLGLSLAASVTELPPEI